MMTLEENSTKNNDDSEALKTNEILSLLSKTKQDFIKDLEFSENISNLFKKKTLIDMANKAKSKIEGVTSKENLKNVKSEKIEEKPEDDTNQKEEKKVDEKKYTEVEAKNLANNLAKDYYNKGFQLGVKQTKEELEKGEKALAVALKSLTDNIFKHTPQLTEKIIENINENILITIKEVLGYEIDTKTDFFVKKIEKVANLFEESTNKIKMLVNEEDYKALTKYLNDNQIKLNFTFEIDKKLERGDLKIKSGAIEVGDFLEKKIKFSNDNNNLEKDLLNLKNKTQNLEKTKSEKDQRTLGNQKNEKPN